MENHLLIRKKDFDHDSYILSNYFIMVNKTYKVLSVDPGLTSCGYALIEYDPSTNNKIVLRYGTITGKSLLKNQKEMQPFFEKRHIIVWELEALFLEMIPEMNPDFVVVEEPFAHLYIQAYAALIIVVQAIRTAVKKTMKTDIYLIAPKEAKKAISNDGTSGKEAVAAAIVKNPNISIKICKQNTEEGFTEHACDAIAVGIAFIQNQLLSILVSKNIS